MAIMQSRLPTPHCIVFKFFLKKGEKKESKNKQTNKQNKTKLETNLATPLPETDFSWRNSHTL